MTRFQLSRRVASAPQVCLKFQLQTRSTRGPLETKVADYIIILYTNTDTREALLSTLGSNKKDACMTV